MAVFRAFPSSLRFQRRLFPYIPPLLALLVVSWLALFMGTPSDELSLDADLDSDLCPSREGDIPERAVFLLDLRKPLDVGQTSLPAALLREMTMELDANTELQVFAVTGTSAAPRRLLDHACKPYDNAELGVDGAAVAPDCNDIPSALPTSVRERASRFCEWRSRLRGRLEELAIQQRDQPVANAFLVEAIEDTVLDFAEFSGRRSLYIFSDMMQYATWHSQTEGIVEHIAFVEPRQVGTSFAPPPRIVDDLRVTIFYLPRRGVTEDSQTRIDHKDFWRDYFADFAGTDIEFEDQPVMSAYEAESLATEPTEIELLAREREQLRLEQEEIERALAAVERERTALETARQLAAEEREAREAQLRRQEELARARESEREVERQRLEAERIRLQEERSEVERRLVAGTLAAQPAEDAVARESNLEPRESPVASISPPRSILARSVDPDAGEETAERAVPHSSVDSSAPGIAHCATQLKPEFATAGDFYPGNRRVNYGGAVITIRYALDTEGETVDDETTVVVESSNATRSRFLDALVQDTVELVRSWEFAYTQGDACERSQVQTAVFRYRSKCVGAPVPKCRTIQSGVTLSAGS